jgi:hypothetical protein
MATEPPPTHHDPDTGTPPTWLRWLIWLIGALACVSGGMGFMSDAQWQVDCASLHKAFLSTLQLFVLNVGAENLHNIWTRAASLLAPLATASAVALALHEVALRRWRRWALHWHGQHELVLGGGHLAAAIFARALPRTAKGHLVGVDPAPAPPLANVLRRLAAAGRPSHMVQGDARADALLRDLNAAKARRIWVLTGDDLLNLDIARRLFALRKAEEALSKAKARAADLPAQTILVGVHDPQLVRAQQQLWPLSTATTTVHHLDVARLAARQLLMTHPPAYPPLDSPRPLHLCVLGDSELSLALLAHAAAHCVYAEAPTLALHLTLVSPRASATRARLCHQHPVLDPRHAADPTLASLLPLATVHTLDADPATLMPGQWQALQQIAPFDMVYVSAEHDLLTCAAALRALALRDATHTPPAGAARIVACVNDRGASQAGDPARWPAPLATFDLFKACFGQDEAYPGERADRRAKFIHWAYQQAGGLPARPAEAAAQADRAWREQTQGDDFSRWSSRMAADHIDVKLATVGLHVCADEAPATAATCTPEQVRQRLQHHLPALARLEHRRYLAERLVDGWLPLPDSHQGPAAAPSACPYSPGPGSQKNLLHLNTTLLPFDQLHDAADREKDQRVVQVTLDGLAAGDNRVRPAIGWPCPQPG